MTTVEDIDYLLAGNPNTPLKVLDRLALDKHQRVRRHVAENINTPPAVLSRLARDPDVEVVSAVAVHPAISRELRAELALHDSVEVRYSIAEYPLARASILFILVEDDNPYVRDRALQTIRKYWVQDFCSRL